MAERVWADVLVDDLYDGDTVEGHGLILDIWNVAEDILNGNCCGVTECCGPTYRVLTYGIRFENGSTEFWKFSKPIRAFVDPDWTVIRDEDARS